MFKTVTPKGTETQARILASALTLFRERGFDATTMRDVATESGMSLGAAYHYFPTKEAIVLAYYVQVAAEHARRVEEQMPRVRSLGGKLSLAINTKLDILGDDRPLLGALLRFTGQPSHPLSFLGKTTRGIQLHNMSVLAMPLRELRLPAETNALAPVALWAMHMGILLYFLYDDSPGQRRTRSLVDGSVAIFVASLKLARLPGIRAIPRKILTLLSDAGLVPSAEEIAAFSADPSSFILDAGARA
jgi:AcrR family transcriptional regulator